MIADPKFTDELYLMQYKPMSVMKDAVIERVKLKCNGRGVQHPRVVLLTITTMLLFSTSHLGDARLE